MSGSSCPECGRTPVYFILSQKFWQCKHCRYTWREENGEKEPVYFISTPSDKEKKNSKQ